MKKREQRMAGLQVRNLRYKRIFDFQDQISPVEEFFFRQGDSSSHGMIRVVREVHSLPGTESRPTLHGRSGRVHPLLPGLRLLEIHGLCVLWEFRFSS